MSLLNLTERGVTIPSTALNISPMTQEVECILIELNFINKKWHLNRTYILRKSLAPLHSHKFDFTLVNTIIFYYWMIFYERPITWLTLNTSPTCLKNPVNPICIEFIIVNIPRLLHENSLITTTKWLALFRECQLCHITKL